MYRGESIRLEKYSHLTQDCIRNLLTSLEVSRYNRRLGLLPFHPFSFSLSCSHSLSFTHSLSLSFSLFLSTSLLGSIFWLYLVSSFETVKRFTLTCHFSRISTRLSLINRLARLEFLAKLAYPAPFRSVLMYALVPCASSVTRQAKREKSAN